MRHLAAFALLLCLFAAAPARAQTAEEQARLDWVLQRGRLIYDIDRAAWVTTDDLRARNGLGNDILGWTVERDGNGYLVVYYARGEGETLVAVYRGRVEGGRVVSGELFPAGRRPPLTAIQRRIAAARSAMEGFASQPCTRSRFNLAVIPPESPDATVELYALTAQTETGVFPFGGHYLVTVGADGRIASQRPFTNTCLNMPVPRPGGSRSETPGVTHLLDPLPTEIHVFLSIWLGTAFFVATETPHQRLWRVHGSERIELIPAGRAPRI